jgi:hypothetical protein
MHSTIILVITRLCPHDFSKHKWWAVVNDHTICLDDVQKTQKRRREDHMIFIDFGVKKFIVKTIQNFDV